MPNRNRERGKVERPRACGETVVAWSGYLTARPAMIEAEVGLLKVLGGGWQASAGANANAESHTGTMAPAAATQPEPAVTPPAAG
ncbi:hypothetical protein [Burkholderia sp. IMCC1007]|uniref:hypothetical protein n=1 Tax=Burkholderia sp. IMCC1007 TaxID=3004104 RepID=UPI0022B4BA1E|nr:hypothetical protein [Burkholderia sp. IMCC1007]